MFTGIIETVGELLEVKKVKTNLEIQVKTNLVGELHVDQSISHNGICLTVEEISGNSYKLTAINETIQKTSIKYWKPGDLVNLERCMSIDGRLDGHIVQGHVDQTGEILSIKDMDGSKLMKIGYKNHEGVNITVEKGSITLNGISLTVFESNDDNFSVAIIPYTWENTNLKRLKTGDTLNLEFDILGKYVQKLMSKRV